MAANNLPDTLRARLAAPQWTPADVMACADQLQHLAQEAQSAGTSVQRVAVVGDLTSDLLARAVACAIAQEGVLPLLYAAPYGVMQQECLDPDSALHAFRPDVVVLIPDWRNTWPALPVDTPVDRVDADTQAQVRRFEALWDALEARRCIIIQHTLVPPSQQLRGIAERRSPASMASRVDALNTALFEAGAGRVCWLQADQLAAQVGRVTWSPARYYYAGKLGFDPRFLADYLPWFRGAWRAATGRAKKLLVLDLDDTLWGGTIGDDGPEGIALGLDHGARGEAFAAWQQYIAQLGQRGVVLAVCSKNDLALAVSGLSHAVSALSRSDFSAFVCSWSDKATGLRQIATELNLSLDTMVFVDDNPAERSLIEQILPEVALVDLGTDPAQFIERLESGHWFDLQSYTVADLRRTATYTARCEALATQSTAADLSTYLEGLEMVGRLAVAQAADLPRLTQLELKTNQFNLTTRRYAQPQLAATLARPDQQLLVFQLKDRFGDHGQVSSMLLVREGDVLRIDSWLMSCRVFSRSAEQFMLVGLIALAKDQGATTLSGEYLPSSRNGVVADLYPRLGFIPACTKGRYWRRNLAAPISDLTSHIRAG
ncbi:HAD-IIIC family phosphatase [Candidatus Aalborgicola defluviihabitans]|uniref:HAD-IIIC family phosphatase n=1 Tax=Candidatus Aalborgicola defluviihabitans TaxID=3386187 RepID=UPI001DF6D273|nr:HAD-IIIC family phosphatase [Burkholderiales bacterium]MBK7312363.1 HAD-IIIC family phosphatase [Burkholderiales bacterium]